MESWADMALPFNNLLIVDGLNLAFRYKHKGTRDFAADYVRTINSLAKSYRARKVVVTLDKGSSEFRKDLHPRYKMDRKERFSEQTEEEKQAAANFFEDFEKAVELCQCNFTNIRFQGVEADDLAAYLVLEFEDGEEFDHIWLISTDADWDLLLSENVSRFSYTSRKEFTLDNFYDNNGCDTPEEFISVKAIMGDKGDSIYGVEGIGVKRAYGLVRQYGSSLDLADALPLDGKQKFIQKLNESEEKLILNTQLVDLKSFCAEAIAYPNPENINELNKIIEEIKEEV